MRLFVSIDLPESLVEEVREVQAAFDDAEGLSFVDPTQVHVTLKFLGEVDERRSSASRTESGDVEEADLPAVEEAIAAAVEEAGVEPFTAEFGGLGVFPSFDYISVVWLGVREGGAEMTRLHEALESRLVDLGFDPEDHEFTPHVTLARMNHAGGKELVQEVVRERDPTVGTMEVSEIRVTESELTHEGPDYSTVARFPL